MQFIFRSQDVPQCCITVLNCYWPWLLLFNLCLCQTENFQMGADETNKIPASVKKTESYSTSCVVSNEVHPTRKKDRRKWGGKIMCKNLVRRSIKFTFLARSENSARTSFIMHTSSSGPSLSGVIREYHKSVTHSDTICLVNWSIASSTTGESTFFLQSDFLIIFGALTYFLWLGSLVTGCLLLYVAAFFRISKSNEK